MNVFCDNLISNPSDRNLHNLRRFQLSKNIFSIEQLLHVAFTGRLYIVHSLSACKNFHLLDFLLFSSRFSNEKQHCDIPNDD